MNRRAFAMLLVLITLVLAVTAAANVARISTTAMSTENAEHSRRLCDDLLGQAEQAAAVWLRTDSNRAVVPPSRATSGITILREQIGADELMCRIAVTAYDLLGMPPIGALLDGSEFRSILPDDVLHSLDPLDDAAPPLGSDQADTHSLRRPVFPRSTDLFSPLGSEWPSIETGSTEGPPALAVLVAFLNSTTGRNNQPGSPMQPILLNVNTAPIPLLDRAFSMAGLDALNTVIEAREDGNPARLEIQAGQDDPVRFTSRSTQWAFMIEVRVGSITRARWTEFELLAGNWRLIRRFRIDD